MEDGHEIDKSFEYGIMTCEEVARWLQINPRQVQRLGIPAITLGRRTTRYDRAVVSAWLQERTTNAGKASALPTNGRVTTRRVGGKK